MSNNESKDFKYKIAFGITTRKLPSRSKSSLLFREHKNNKCPITYNKFMKLTEDLRNEKNSEKLIYELRRLQMKDYYKNERKFEDKNRYFYNREVRGEYKTNITSNANASAYYRQFINDFNNVRYTENKQAKLPLKPRTSPSKNVTPGKNNCNLNQIKALKAYVFKKRNKDHFIGYGLVEGDFDIRERRFYH